MIIDLPYGRGSVSAPLPDGVAVEHWRARVAPAAVRERDIVARALDEPIGTPPLANYAAGARRISVLISGKDRVAGARVYLPVILDRLAVAGIADRQIEIVCATGTHARHSPEDVRALIGDDVAARIRFRTHDCSRDESFVDLGHTSYGTPVRLDRAVVEADLRVLTGRVTHHYFAGFSGGRKSLLPGVAARTTIEANHRRVLDFSSGCRIHPSAFGGNLVANPVHRDMVEAARKTGRNFVVNTLVDAAHRISHAFAGELEAAHETACLEAARTAVFAPDYLADLVVASSGGHPYDINLIQSLKALFNHRNAVRPGGVFILVAEAAGGILAGMKGWMGWADRVALGRAMASHYDLAAHNSRMLLDTLERTPVVIVSRLPAADLREVGLLPAPDLSEALAIAQQLLGRRPSTLRVIHHGNVTQCDRPDGRIRPADIVEREFEPRAG